MDLFNTNDNGAIFSDNRKYRYVLWRIWDDELPTVMFIGLNPSTANEITDDPTIRRVKKFARDWGFGGVYMLNLFAFVTPYPKDLYHCDDPVADNDLHLKLFAGVCEEIVFAWGSFPEAEERSKEVVKMFPEGKALAINKNGTPRHPLYMPADTELVLFT